MVDAGQEIPEKYLDVWYSERVSTPTRHSSFACHLLPVLLLRFRLPSVQKSFFCKILSSNISTNKTKSIPFITPSRFMRKKMISSNHTSSSTFTNNPSTFVKWIIWGVCIFMSVITNTCSVFLIAPYCFFVCFYVYIVITSVYPQYLLPKHHIP